MTVKELIKILKAMPNMNASVMICQECDRADHDPFEDKPIQHVMEVRDSMNSEPYIVIS